MSDTAEFILARIAEDEEKARRIHAANCDTPAEVIPDSMGRPMEPVCGCDWYVARVLAECDAKRRIVALEYDAQADDWQGERDAAMRQVLELLALPYADHPDYDQARGL